MSNELGPAFEKDDNIVFFNAASRAHWLWSRGVNKDLVLVHSGRWPEGAILTQEAFELYRLKEHPPHLPVQGTLIAPDTAAWVYAKVLVSSDITDIFMDEIYGPR